MRNLILSLALLVFILSCSKKKTEVDATEITTPSHDRFNKIKFIDTKVGFIVGGEQFLRPTMLKTNDGGDSWYEVSLPTNNERKEIYGFDLFSNGQMITVGYGGTIFFSHDTGKTFQYLQHGSWKELKDIAFVNKDTAIIAGGTGFNQGHLSLFKTDGSGPNQITENIGFELTDIDAVDTSTFYYAGYGAILKSVDRGKTHDFTKAKNDFFTAMCWNNKEEGIAVGYEGSILRTTDGGNAWKVIRNGNDFTKKKIHFLDVERNAAERLVAVGEHGAVFISEDNGSSWKEANKFTSNDLRGVFFRDNQTCFVVGENGTLFRLTF
ncbi:ycf48-like protein [Filimonas sp.]|nr:ycf48-like protein [Filimonas sp.]